MQTALDRDDHVVKSVCKHANRQTCRVTVGQIPPRQLESTKGAAVAAIRQGLGASISSRGVRGLSVHRYVVGELVPVTGEDEHRHLYGPFVWRVERPGQFGYRR